MFNNECSFGWGEIIEAVCHSIALPPSHPIMTLRLSLGQDGLVGNDEIAGSFISIFFLGGEQTRTDIAHLTRQALFFHHTSTVTARSVTTVAGSVE